MKREGGYAVDKGDARAINCVEVAGDGDDVAASIARERLQLVDLLPPGNENRERKKL
ncbi:hypothetical protein JCGZ_26490 [Jatropha curcas]|uniref:Uncharacterized protein n=1 Tax=Jatropha curcas TaxID=180498 RepID=A0A067LFU5_JATCU|nr:hypothetical protein JCGZ_26490 [Jatropha curcas]